MYCYYSITGLFKKDVCMSRSYKKYHESDPIKDARFVVESRTENIGFPNIFPCLFNAQNLLLLSKYFKIFKYLLSQ